MLFSGHFQIFEMIFEMRANSKYQLGFSRMFERAGDDEKDSISALVPPFSPYIVVDHKHGQRLHLAHLHKEEEEKELEQLGFASGAVIFAFFFLIDDSRWCECEQWKCSSVVWCSFIDGDSYLQKCGINVTWYSALWTCGSAMKAKEINIQ